ncbi:MAG: hypothetical protein M1818_001214 [Claussenomyces sp. TS43310]|nr:MAG: hypothetical protein M1818_001214 [Claussenomyces sp. TS43310]
MQPSKKLSADQSTGRSRPHSKRKLSTCQKTEEAPSTVTPQAPRYTQSTIFDSLYQSKRQKNSHEPASLNFQDKMSQIVGLKGRPDVVDSMRRDSRFQPHAGAKKLMIKNLRKEPRTDVKVYYETISLQLDEALGAIFLRQQPRQPLERLYRDVEDLCRKGEAESLYEHLRRNCQAHLERKTLQVIQNNLGGKDSIEVLRGVHDCWQMWTSHVVILLSPNDNFINTDLGLQLQLRSIFGFLDRSFLLSSKLHPQLNDMAITLFRTVIFGSKQVAETTYRGVCDLVHLDRVNDNRFDRTLLKDAITMLHVIDLYKAGFEPEFLLISKSFYVDFGETHSDQGLKYYISKCVTLLEKESRRCDLYNFDSGTKRRLLADTHRVLVKEHAADLLDQAGVSKLLEASDIDPLRDLYSLLLSSNMQGDLKGPWEEHIKQTGALIVKDPSKSDEMVIRLLELKRTLDVIIRDAFKKDEVFKFAMREAYSSFINDRKNTLAWAGNSLVGEVIAKYIDLLLRGGLKAVPRSLASDATDRSEAEKQGQASTGDEDAELDRQLEQGLELFRFIEGKDVFEAFYKKDLARRLLMGRSASQDAERSMLTKLKSECGSNFTHNLEQMFKDQELSRDEMISYKQSLTNTSRTTLDLQVSVLSAAAWPTYPDVKVNLPDEVARHIEKFDYHYKYKHTGRRLAWKHALAHSIVVARFNKGVKELIVSGFQAIVLELFNGIGPDGNLSYVDIQSACGLIDAELQRTLQSLACTKLKVLNKHPKGRDVNKTDTFTINVGFTDPKFRIKINQIQLKETKEENKETHERVAADRQYETQAAIVRIMKSRRVMTHANLVSEVINQTRSRGAVEVGEIKKNIEKLIEKDYIERDEGSYTYLA